MMAHNKMLEIQISQRATNTSRPLRKFCWQPKTNPWEHRNDIITRSGKQLEKPEMKGDGLSENELNTSNTKKAHWKNHWASWVENFTTWPWQ